MITTGSVTSREHVVPLLGDRNRHQTPRNKNYKVYLLQFTLSKVIRKHSLETISSNSGEKSELLERYFPGVKNS